MKTTSIGIVALAVSFCIPAHPLLAQRRTSSCPIPEPPNDGPVAANPKSKFLSV
jgi:hypothetical protein